MYGLYKIFGTLSRWFSTAMIIIFIPLSIIFCAIGWILFFLKEILIQAGAPDLVQGDATQVLNILKWVGLGLALFIIVLYVVFLVSWILKKLLFKKVADNYISRNKEFRNRDINRTIDRLENYRYRD